MSRSDAAKRINKHIANLGNADSAIACRAEGFLMRCYGSRALEPLITACSNVNPQVRYRAAWALGHTRDARAYETILRLTNDADGAVRYDATVALGISGDARAVAPLVALLQTPDPECSVDVAAAMGLERLGHAAVPALINALGEGTENGRCLAASTLGSIGDSRAVEPLTELLSSTTGVVQTAAQEALAEIVQG